MIVAQGLSKRFGQIMAVNSLDFEIEPGDVVGFLGPNGAGKTTTIRMITGYLPPTSGRVTVDGLDVTREPRRVRSKIGYLPESAPLYHEMRVIEYLHYRARLFGLDRAARRRAIPTALRHCWLEDVRRRPIAQLSKGYRQRVGLAAALLHDPQVLVLDEPTVGLDPAQIREVRSLVRELAGRHTVLLSTHLLHEAELTCDRILMIARGRVRAHGTIDELRGAASRLARYVLEVDSDRATDRLRGLAGVRSVDSMTIDDRWRRVTVTAERGTADLREQIARLVAGTEVMLRELHRDAPTLETLFIQMVADADTVLEPLPGAETGT